MRFGGCAALGRMVKAILFLFDKFRLTAPFMNFIRLIIRELQIFFGLRSILRFSDIFINMIRITSIISTDKVEIFEVTGFPHNPNVNVGIEPEIQKLVNDHQQWMFNRYTCDGNSLQVLVRFYKE